MTEGIVRKTHKRGDIEWHGYKCQIHNAGEFPGCTTIINQMSKPFLTRWMKMQTALAAIELRDELPKMLKSGTEEAVAAMLVSSGDRRRDTAGNRGTRVHAAIEHVVRDEDIDACVSHDPPCRLTEDIADHVDGFHRWMADAKPQVRASEFMVISETHRYGATGDLAAVLDGELWLIDAKTSKSVYADTSFQLAAIRWADHASLAGDPKEYAVPKATRFGVLHVTDHGSELVPFDVRPDHEWKAFLACRDLYEWNKKRAREVMRSAA